MEQSGRRHESDDRFRFGGPIPVATTQPQDEPCYHHGGQAPYKNGHFVSENAPIREQSGYLNVNKANAAGYVYVADGKAQALEVYRFGFSAPPIRWVPLDGPGFAVCTDDAGRVYVTEQLNSEVQVFEPGAVHAIGKLQGVNEPDGCTTANGKVYVANHPTSGTDFGFVTVYAAGKMNAVSVIPSAPKFAPLGVAVDAKGDVFESAIGQIGPGTGGVLLEYAPGTSGSNFHLIAMLCQCAVRGGIAMDGRGNVVVGDEGFLTAFYAPDFTRKVSKSPPQAGILGFFTHNAFGTLVPINDGDGKSSVTVYPESGWCPTMC